MRAFNRLLLAGTSPLAILIAGASGAWAQDVAGETINTNTTFSSDVIGPDNGSVGTTYGYPSTGVEVRGSDIAIRVEQGVTISGGQGGVGGDAVVGVAEAGNGGYSQGMNLNDVPRANITIAEHATVTGGTGGTGGNGTPPGLGGGAIGIRVEHATGVVIENAGTIASGTVGQIGTGGAREGRMWSSGIDISNYSADPDTDVATSTITNLATGKILGNNAVGVSSAAKNVKIDNRGEISGGGQYAGISIQSDNGGQTDIVNTGRILGGNQLNQEEMSGEGIAITGFATGAINITNSGTIKSGNADINDNLGAAITIIGGHATIDNSGTVTAGNAAGNTPRVAMDFADAHNKVVLNNRGGAIDGSIVTSSQGDELNFYGGELRGSILATYTSMPDVNNNPVYTGRGAPGAAVSFQSGTTLVSGDIGLKPGEVLGVGYDEQYAKDVTFYGRAVASVTVADGATLAFGANSNIFSQSMSLGSDSAIDLRTSKVTWNYVAGGSENLASTFVLKTTIGTTSHGYWVFSGMPGTTMFNNGVPVITPTVLGTVSTGSRYVIVQDSAGRSVVNLPSVVNGGGYTWAVSSVTGSGQSDSHGVAYGTGTTNVVITATNLNAAGAATGTGGAGVRALATYSGNDAGLQALSQAVNNLTSDADIKKAGAQLRPESTVNTAQASMGAVTQALGTIQVRTDAVRVAASEGGSGISSGETLKGLGVWGQAFGATASQDDRGEVSGYDSDTYGLAFGGDFQVLDPLRVGLSFAYAQTNVDSTGDRSGSGQDINSYITSLYGTYSGKGWYVDGTLTWGIHKYDATRHVAIAGAAAQSLKADYSGQQYGAKVESGLPLAVGPTVVTPLVSLAYNNLHQDAYSESGGSAALRVNSSSTDSIRSGLGAKASAKVATLGNWEVRPNGRAVWYHEFNKSSPEQTSSYVAGGSSFTTPGNDAATEHFNLGLGVDIASVRNTTISAKYDADLADKYVGHSASLQLRTEF